MRRGDRYRYVRPSADRLVAEVRRIHNALRESALKRGRIILSFQGTTGRQMRLTFRFGDSLEGDFAPIPNEPDWAGLQRAAEAICQSVDQAGDTTSVLDVVIDTRGGIVWAYQPGRVIAGVPLSRPSRPDRIMA